MVEFEAFLKSVRVGSAFCRVIRFVLDALLIFTHTERYIFFCFTEAYLCSPYTGTNMKLVDRQTLN